MSYCVLFVDDEPNVLAALQRALHAAPFQVLVAGSADQAAALLRERPVDVIVSDEQMPGTSGIELLAAVAERHPDTIRILLTGHPTLANAVRAINEGKVHKYLTKPCDEARLVWTIRSALECRDPTSSRAATATQCADSDPLLERAKLFRRLRSSSAVDAGDKPRRAARSWNETPLFAEQEDCDGGRPPLFDDAAPNEE